MKCFSVGRLTPFPQTKTGGSQRESKRTIHGAGSVRCWVDQDLVGRVGRDEMAQVLTSQLSPCASPAAVMLQRAAVLDGTQGLNDGMMGEW